MLRHLLRTRPGPQRGQRGWAVVWLWAAWLLLGASAGAAAVAADAAPAAPAVSGAASAAAAPASAPGVQVDAFDAGQVLRVNKRLIVSFRASLLGRTPAQRVTMAQLAIDAALERDGPDRVTVWLDGQGTAGLQIDGNIVFYLVPDDLQGAPPAALAEAAEVVGERLQAALLEVRETRDLRRIAEGLGRAVVASGVAYGLARVLFAVRRRVLAAVEQAARKWRQRLPSRGFVNSYARHAKALTHAIAALLCWGLVLLVGYGWATFVMGQFAYTRPWAEQASAWLLGVLGQFGAAIAGAVPGLLIALLIFALARLATRACSAFMRRVERGEVQVGWLEADFAGPTRRITNFVVWLFAVAIAYPFLPGANSEAFKGVSVLAGLMISLGASGVVGQVVSGLSLMYSRSLRPGEYVRIGDTEGTVSTVGLFATKLNTGLGEEVSLPNAFVFSQPVRNFSRGVEPGQFVLHVGVTIGYATPWRQVHAMLLEATRRAPGVAQEPAPCVVQTALSDFYVEYRLCAQSSRAAPRRRAEALSQLHAAVQDVFNENGVQIMSPHYRADPPAPQVVPREAWAPPLARRKPDPPAPEAEV